MYVSEILHKTHLKTARRFLTFLGGILERFLERWRELDQHFFDIWAGNKALIEDKSVMNIIPDRTRQNRLPKEMLSTFSIDKDTKRMYFFKVSVSSSMQRQFILSLLLTLSNFNKLF